MVGVPGNFMNWMNSFSKKAIKCAKSYSIKKRVFWFDPQTQIKFYLQDGVGYMSF